MSNFFLGRKMSDRKEASQVDQKKMSELDRVK